MGTLCSDARDGCSGRKWMDSEEELYNTLSERHRNHVMTHGMLSLDIIPELSGLIPKSEEVSPQLSKSDKLHAVIHNQQLEIDRLTKLCRNSVQEEEMKSKVDSRDLKKNKWSNEADVKVPAEVKLDILNAMKPYDSEILLVERSHDLDNLSYLSGCSTDDHHSVGIVQTISNSDFSGDIRCVSLQDIEVPIKAKEQNHHHRAESLPDIQIRARAWQNISCSGSTDSKFSNSEMKNNVAD